MQRWAGASAVAAMVLHLVLGCARLHAHDHPVPATHGDAPHACSSHECDDHDCGDHDCGKQDCGEHHARQVSANTEHSRPAAPAECPCEARCRTTLQFVKVERTQPADSSTWTAFDVPAVVASAQLLSPGAVRILDDDGPPARYALPLHLALGRLLI